MPTILYHASCVDGFTSAFLAWQRYGDRATYIPVHYQEPPPKIDKNEQLVLVLDFSYDAPTLSFLTGFHGRVVVLDHHATAREALRDLALPGLDVIFDMEHSGARLTWDYLNPGREAPWLVRYVEDRDLWKWEVPDSREINEVLQTVEDRNWANWAYLLEHLERPAGRAEFASQGRALVRVKQKHIDVLLGAAKLVDIGGHRVPAVNTTIYQSDVGEQLCKKYPDSPFAATWFCPEPGQEVWSLRSRSRADGSLHHVGQTAKLYGGGGHPGAAGFRVPGGTITAS